MASERARTCVVTGSESGIGRATRSRLKRDGWRVIGVDLHDAEVVADLATAAGRRAMVERVAEAADGHLDVVVANAGVADSAEGCVRVNHFGAIATLEGLRPLLVGASAPRAVLTASSSIINDNDPAVVAACLAGDEEAAVEAAGTNHLAAYPSTKRAVARWMRTVAPGPEWAGAGIALNAVAPGIVATPMVAPLVADPAMVELMTAAVPMPLGGIADPTDVAEAIAFLASPATTRICGQVLFIDGGADAVLRGDDIW